MGALDSFCEGDFQVQDAASIQVAESAGIKAGDYIIDVCAAPGGKALHAAQILTECERTSAEKVKGHVEARDLTEYKTDMIRENIERMGFANIEAICRDAAVYDEASEEKADVLIADLPCSGLGVLAKKSDIKYKMTEETERELVQLQREILTAVHSYVKPGGTLVYSTCTVCRAENSGNAAWFAETFADFTMEWEKQIFPSRESDGFYIAKFNRKKV